MSGSAAASELGENDLDLLAQLRNVAADRLPHNGDVDVEVAVGEDVAHPDDLLPSNIAMMLTNRGGESCGRFADHLEPSLRRRLHELVRCEHIAVGDVAFQVGTRLDDVFETLTVISHRGTASASTTARTVGRRLSAVTTSTSTPRRP